MPVGTGDISLSNVTAEIAGTQTSLQDCVDDHDPDGINPTYGSAPITSLAEFRGYDDSPSCVATTSLNFYATSSSASNIGACAGGGSESTLYFAPAGGDVNNGDTVYTSSSGCTAFNGGNNYFRIRANGGGFSFFSIRISSAGLVSNKFSC